MRRFIHHIEYPEVWDATTQRTVTYTDVQWEDGSYSRYHHDLDIPSILREAEAIDEALKKKRPRPLTTV